MAGFRRNSIDEPFKYCFYHNTHTITTQLKESSNGVSVNSNVSVEPGTLRHEFDLQLRCFQFNNLWCSIELSEEKPAVDRVKSNFEIDEGYVLVDDLSNQSTISPRISPPINLILLDQLTLKRLESSMTDFYCLERNWEGYFFKTLKGKSTIENALVNTGVD